jgi:predicted nucleotidyltransferase
MDLQNLLGCPVDVVTEKGLKKRIRQQVLKEAISL